MDISGDRDHHLYKLLSCYVSDALSRSVSFPEGKTWLGEKLLHPSHRRFLLSLTGMPLEEMLRVSCQLSDDHSHLCHQLAELAAQEYRSIIEFHMTAARAKTALAGIQSNVHSMADRSPMFAQAARKVIAALKTRPQQLSGNSTTATVPFNLEEERSELSVLSQSFAGLTEIMAVHQLMENLVAAEQFEAAIDLRDHVHHLAIRFLQIPLISKTVVSAVELLASQMTVKLVMSLKMDVTVHTSIKLIGLLRRLQSCNDDELRMIFLKSRLEYFIVCTNRLSLLSDPVVYLKSYLDACRSQFAEIITQYLAVFSSNNAAILALLMNHLLSQMTATIKSKLKTVADFSHFVNIIVQAMHLGVSLSRKGFDVRYRIVEIAEAFSLDFIGNAIDSALEECRLNIVDGDFRCWPHTLAMADEDAKEVICHYPALAKCTNSILDAFNSLRLLPSLSLNLPIIRTLQVQAKNFVDFLTEDTRIKMDPPVIKSFETVVANYWLPYILQLLNNELFDGVVHALDENEMGLRAEFS
eukprot:Partr_v1_DN25881_c0_g1_i1_m2481 putative Oligomeric golgi complex